MVEKLLLDGKRTGLNLPDEEPKEFEKLQKELSQTCVEFGVRFVPRTRRTIAEAPGEQKNLNEEKVRAHTWLPSGRTE